MMLDEPTSSQAQIIDLFTLFTTKYHLGYLFISHDLKFVKALAHEVIVVCDGEMVEHGFSHPKILYTDFDRCCICTGIWPLISNDIKLR
ncbi:hypothetical protein O93_00733 [Bartonella quintana JK 19]|nr:hypothetical protein O93_00733 [Bartonella quintana JK 19]KEC68793.1 hypothetical protein O7Q_00575 [Bartonella quintana JK 39]